MTKLTTSDDSATLPNGPSDPDGFVSMLSNVLCFREGKLYQLRIGAITKRPISWQRVMTAEEAEKQYGALLFTD